MCRIILSFFSMLLILSFSYVAQAELTAKQARALEQTQNLLRNPEKRMKAVNSSAEAVKAHQRAMSLLGSEQNVNKAYDMAAIMLKTITEEANGDPAKMKAILNRAKSNPEALAERMPAEFKSLLKVMSDDIERKGSPARN